MCSGFALFALIVGTNMPSPFYAVYAEQFDFSPLTLTLIFAAYTGALIPTLLFAASLAETLGYRRVLVPGFALAVAGTVVFAAAESVGMLVVARVLQGVAVGVSSGALTAALTQTAGEGKSSLGSTIASVTTTTGGGLGPVIAGFCAVVLPAPTRTTYLIEVGVLLLAAVGLFSLPAGLGRTGARWHPRLPQIPQIPAQKRAFFTACAVSFTGWAVTAVFLSIVPTYVTTLTGNDSLLVAGMAAGLVLVVAAAIQPFVAHLRGDTLERAGLMALALGLVALLVAGMTQSLGVVLLSAVVAGVGQGMGFMGAMRQSAEVAPDGAEAATASAFYVATYVGVGLPTIGVGLLATWLGTVMAVDIFAGVILVLSVGVVVGVRPGRQRTVGSSGPAR